MVQQRVRVKICGLTQIDDVDTSVQAGADAIGLVFYAKSARAVNLARARELRDAVPAFVDVVALFVNAPHAEVLDVIDQVDPDLLQFHGDESPGYCASFGRRYIRAFRLGAPALASSDAVLENVRAYSDAAGWLFDSYSSGYGGSGLAFDAGLLRGVQSAKDGRPLILSGGLAPQTVAAAVETLRPYAVDVSSGVEASPGIKSAEKIKAFIAAVRSTQRL
ncbi:MAG TPA: phosphoribosylanthranilate isomerase [Paralcaligenes sp.]